MLSHYQRRAEATLQRAPKTKFPVFNDYVLLERIGSGAFGMVHLAMCLRTMQPVAVKIIDKNKARQKGSSLRVRREIIALQTLSHPNVTKFVDVVSTKSFVLLVMEFIEGGELYDEIKYFHRFSEPYARFFFQQLVRGMEYCHQNGVYHRDLKPDNLLLDRDKTLKITDFGMANVFNPSSGTENAMLQTQCGTPSYFAPEVILISENGYSGAKSDAWSCGVILYNMCSGMLPFDSENQFEIFRQIVRCDVVYPSFFSPDLKDLLSNIFVSNPSSRLSLTQITRHSWFSGPVTTSEIGDDRLERPSKLEQMSGAIQEVIQSYSDYKDASSSRQLTVRVPILLDHSSAPDIASSSSQRSVMSSRVERKLAHDSLALGWVGAGESTIGFPGANLPTEEIEKQLLSASEEKYADEQDYASDTEEGVQSQHGSPGYIVDELLNQSESNTSELTTPEAPPVEADAKDESIYAPRRARSLEAVKIDKRLLDPTCRTYSSDTWPTERKQRSVSFAVSSYRSESWASSDTQLVGEVGPEADYEHLRLKLWDALAKTYDSVGDSTGGSTDVSEVLLPTPKSRRLVRSKSVDRIEIVASQNSRYLSDEKIEGEWTKSTSETKFEPHGFRCRNRMSSRDSIPLDSVSDAFSSNDEDGGNAEYYAGMWEEKDMSNKVWCQLMKDFNTIPDQVEHGLPGKTLQKMWSESLEQEGIRKRRPRKRCVTIRSPITSQPLLPVRLPPSDIAHPLALEILRTNQASSGDLNVAKSLPALREEATVVIGGDLLTGLSQHWSKKLLEKTAINYDEEASIKQVQSMSKRSSIANTLRYYNAIISNAKGFTYNVLDNVDTPGTESVSHHGAAEWSDVLNSVPSALDSALSEGRFSTSQNESGEFRHQRVGSGLTRIAIGPIHSDCNLEDEAKRREREELEIASRLKIFEFDIPGPVHPEARPVQNPFAKYLGGPAKFVKRGISPLRPKIRWFRFSAVTFTTLEDMDATTRMVTALLERQGGSVQRTRSVIAPVMMRALLPMHQSKLKLVIHIVRVNNPSIRIACCTVLVRKTSGDEAEFLRFSSGFQTKLDKFQ